MKKIIIGMIHLDYLEGQAGFKGLPFVKAKALKELQQLQEGGVDKVIIENWKDNTFGPFVDQKTIDCLLEITREVCSQAIIPVGINVLPNDYRASFYIAEQCNLSFMQIDVLSDDVKTDYSYSDALPFEIKVDINDFQETRKKYHCEQVQVLASVYPKHYLVVNQDWSLEKSVQRAMAAGVNALVVTGNITGSQPDMKKVKVIKKISSNLPIYIGSGLTKDNFKEYFELVDGAIIGTAFKTPDFEEVDLVKTKGFVDKIRTEYY